MNVFIVANGYRTSLPGLGRNRSIRSLSQKRITKAVREQLCEQYGLPNVEVSCTAKLASDGWHGSCKIYQADFDYKIAARAP
jgi:hypothetical protein